MKRIATIEIRCWSFSIGGEHFNADLVFYDQNGEYTRLEVMHPLSAKEAKYLNKKDETSSYCRYKKGQLSNRFETKEEAIEWAIKTFKKDCSHCFALNIGSACSGDPQKVLVGPEDFKEKVNALFQRKKECGGYEGDTVEMEKIYREYCKLLKDYGIR